ncbi:MAG: hypothetical protein LLF76_05205 [Planctomycetaceae bacterium]|nr:hypothetical protein [Planctomycetaceae bacterium]
MKKRACRRSVRRKGAILSLMVLLTLLLAMTSLALAHLGQQSRLRTIRNTAAMTARLAADGGIERVLYLMNQSLEAGTWTSDSVPVLFDSERLPACKGEYTVTFSGDVDAGYQIVSTGICGSQSKTIRVLVGLTSPFSDDFAVLTKGQLTMKNKSKIGGYNSADPGDTDVHASIGTLSTAAGSIDLKLKTDVDGDVYVGPGGNPPTVIKMKNRQSVAGELFTMPAPYYLPTIRGPGFLASKAAISGNTVELDTNDSGKYTGISINNNGKLEIDGDLVLHITGDVELKNGAKLDIKNGSTLKLYVDGNIDAGNSAGINTASRIASDVRIYGTGTNQTFSLKNSSDLYGCIYAPEALMALDNGGNAKGSFITKGFELKNDGDVYYDKALRDVSLTDEGIRFSVLRWEEL